MKKNILARTAILTAVMVMAACTANAGDASTEKVRKAFESRFAGRVVVSVSKTPVQGVFEVVLKGNRIVYVDQKVDHMFLGELVDVAKQQSLTEKRMSELNRTRFADLPLDLAFKEVRGNGARKLAVFTDPDCPFCKRLEQDSLKGVTNVTIYTFLYPLTELHPDAMNKSRKIWCAPDRLKAWQSFMQDGVALTGSGDCDTSALDRVRELAQKLGIDGTPGLVFGNGRIAAGALPKEELEGLLNAK